MKGLILFFICVFAQESVLFSNIPQLTFYKNEMTLSRRSYPIRQMQCIEGDACGYYEPEVIQCKNIGVNDFEVPQWECKAEMPENYRFGRTDVSCEGYSRKGDPYVLKGSCGVKYTLLSTKNGEYSLIPVLILFSPILFIFFLVLVFVLAFVGFIIVLPIAFLLTICCPRQKEEEIVKKPKRRKNRKKKHKQEAVIVNNNNNNDGPGFWSGYVLGGLIKHHHTSSNNSHTSTGYGGSESR